MRPQEGKDRVTYIPMETDSEGGFFWLYEEMNNGGLKPTCASSCCVRSLDVKR